MNQECPWLPWAGPHSGFFAISAGQGVTNSCPDTEDSVPHSVRVTKHLMISALLNTFCYSSKCDVLHLFCHINLPLQIKDLKQDFLFKFSKKTNTAVFTLLWSSNNPIFHCFKKNPHTLNSSYVEFYSHRFRKNHLPAACSCQIILVNIQNNHPSSPDGRTFSNQKKTSLMQSTVSTNAYILLRSHFIILMAKLRPKQRKWKNKNNNNGVLCFNHGLVWLQYRYNILLRSAHNFLHGNKWKCTFFKTTCWLRKSLLMTNTSFCAMFWTTTQQHHWAWQTLSWSGTNPKLSKPNQWALLGPKPTHSVGFLSETEGVPPGNKDGDPA